MSASIPASDMIEDRATLQTRHPGLLLIAVMATTIVLSLDMTIANVALPHMQTSLGASMDTISWVLTSYIIAGVVMMPVAGWLSDRIGSRRLFILAVAGFILSSMLCGLATSLTEMVLFRTLQGMTTAFIAPMSQTIIFDTNPPSKQPQAVTLWGLSIMVAPISGPVIGGILTESFNWRWIFYINLPIGVAALALLIWLLPSRPIVQRKLDKLGFVMVAAGIGALQLLLDRGQHKDWFNSWEIIIEALIVLGAAWVFAVHASTTRNPIFPGSLVRNFNFLGSAAFMFILGMASVAISAVLPTMFENVYRYDVLETGMLMAPRAFGMTLAMLIIPQVMRRMDMRYLIVLGYLVAAYALWSMSHWSLDMDRRPIVISGFIMGLGLGLISTPINLIAFATLEERFRPDGSGLLTLVRSLGGSVGISIIVTMLARNTQISHADISASVTATSLSAIDLSTTTERLGDLGMAAMQMIDGEVNRQALMIAYLDNFHVVAWSLLICAPLTMLFRPMRVSGGVRPELVE